MNIRLFPASQRGHANHGWLDTYHSFSFADWYDPEMIHFGALRVLNDDTIDSGEGFGMHPHENMEIVTIPLQGALEHKDSTGTHGIINTGDVQIMSAGSGIRHSEFNPSQKEPSSLLQIWVFPKVRNIDPRYDQKYFDPSARKNKWQLLVSPDKESGGLWINQNAVFSRVTLDVNEQITYNNYFPGNGVYLFVIDGSVEVNGQVLNAKDALGISDSHSFNMKANGKADVLAIEIPMNN